VGVNKIIGKNLFKCLNITLGHSLAKGSSDLRAAKYSRSVKAPLRR